MIVWLLLILYILVLRLIIGPLTTPRKRIRFLIWAGAVTALIMGLRGDNYENVYDLYVYTHFYEWTAETPWSELLIQSDFEVGWTVLNKILSFLFPSGQTILILESFFCVFAVSHFIYHNTENVFEAFYFYVTLGSMGFMLTGLRQSVAIGLILLSTQFIKKKRPWCFLFTILIAYTMHRSSLVFIVAYWIFNSKLLRQNKWMLIPTVGTMLIFAPQLINIGVLAYNDTINNNDGLLSFNGIVPILLYTIGLIAQMMVDAKHKKETGEHSGSIIAAMIAIGLGFYLMRFYNAIIERLAWYYTQASYLALANFFLLFKKNQHLKILKWITIILAFVLFFRRVQNAEYGNYSFFWTVSY